VDSVSALLNDARDFSEPHFTGVVNFQCTPGDEPEVIDREQNGIKNRLVRFVKRTIYKNVFTLQTSSLPSLLFETLADYRGHRFLDGLSPQITLTWRLLHCREPMNILPTHGAIATVDDNLTT